MSNKNAEGSLYAFVEHFHTGGFSLKVRERLKIKRTPWCSYCKPPGVVYIQNLSSE